MPEAARVAALRADATASLGLGDAKSAERIHRVLRELGFELHHHALSDTDTLFRGLEEFREHLGGRLTIPLVRAIGTQVDVNSIDLNLMRHAIDRMAAAATDSASA